MFRPDEVSPCCRTLRLGEEGGGGKGVKRDGAECELAKADRTYRRTINVQLSMLAGEALFCFPPREAKKSFFRWLPVPSPPPSPPSYPLSLSLSLSLSPPIPGRRVGRDVPCSILGLCFLYFLFLFSEFFPTPPWSPAVALRPRSDITPTRSDGSSDGAARSGTGRGVGANKYKKDSQKRWIVCSEEEKRMEEI